MRAWIRRKLWKLVLWIIIRNEKYGLLAFRYFAAFYFVVERHDPGPAPGFRKHNDYDHSRQAYFDRNFK